MDDNSIMPWGKYRGEKMANVPASYLLWLFSQHKLRDDIKKYVEENILILEKEVENNKPKKDENNN